MTARFVSVVEVTVARRYTILVDLPSNRGYAERDAQNTARSRVAAALTTERELREQSGIVGLLAPDDEAMSSEVVSCVERERR